MSQGKLAEQQIRIAKTLSVSMRAQQKKEEEGSPHNNNESRKGSSTNIRHVFANNEDPFYEKKANPSGGHNETSMATTLRRKGSKN